MRLRLFTIVPALIALATLAIAQAIVVCRDCAYEIAPEAQFCSHCGAAVIQSATPSGGVASPSASKPIASEQQYASIVAGDLATAVRFMSDAATARPEIALAALLNARAILVIAGPDAIQERERAAVVDGIAAAKDATARTRVTCPRCHGSGQEDVLHEFSTLNSGKKLLPGGKRTCTVCNGRSWLTGLRKTSELLPRIAEGKKAYGDQMLIEGRTLFGNIWLPTGLSDTLTIQQQAALRRFSADPCSACAGFGKANCTACDNLGVTPCKTKGCEGGILRSVDIPSSKKGSRIEATQAAHAMPCPTCKGSSLISCTLCGGAGTVACRVCLGSGERAPCSKCKGEGLDPCRTCKGSGTHPADQACTSCRGEGVTLCASCGGDGHGRR